MKSANVVRLGYVEFNDPTALRLIGVLIDRVHRTVWQSAVTPSRLTPVLGLPVTPSA